MQNYYRVTSRIGHLMIVLTFADFWKTSATEKGVKVSGRTGEPNMQGSIALCLR